MIETSKSILFSGIQPTGEIHIGNYLGALKNWVDLQNKYFCLYSIVDLHAITINYDSNNYQDKILNTALDLLAIGINPKKTILFVQSHVPEHTELCWLFNTITPITELERMVQFKDKAKQHKKNINTGLFDYPVLQAADILLYHGEYIPVGQDQLQHLELTNTILKKFNNKFGSYFKKIKPIISTGDKIMSLTDPAKKMSKSLGPKNLIALSDSPQQIKDKIKSAITDTGPTSNNEITPSIKNLFLLLKLFDNNETYKKFQKAYDNKSIKYSELKAELADAIINYLKPIQEKRKYFTDNKIKIKKILEDGANKAKIIAKKNILEIKKRMGLV